MAKYNTLKELYVDVCNALRKKLGTTDLIKHNEIADNIRNIPEADIDKTIDIDSAFAYGYQYYTDVDTLVSDFNDYVDENPTKLLNAEHMFDNALINMDLSSLNTSSVGNMRYMFANNMNGSETYNSTRLNIDASKLDTSNVTDMSGVFMSSYLGDLNLSSWDTSNVVDMSYMFRDCLASSLDISNFDTSQVTDMGYMFYDCGVATDKFILPPYFDTSNVTNMSYMFYSSTTASKIDTSNFDMSNVRYLTGMFSKSNIASLDVSRWDTSKVLNMSNMFYECRSLTALDLSSLDTASLQNTSDMFYNNYNLTTLNLSGWNTRKLKDTQYMFYGCSNLTTLDISDWDFTTIDTVYRMFCSCPKLAYLDFGGFISTYKGSNASVFNSGTNQNIILDCKGKSSILSNLYLGSIWNGTDKTKINCYETFAKSLGVKEIEGEAKITIYKYLYNTLSDVQKALVTDKGYTLVADT